MFANGHTASTDASLRWPLYQAVANSLNICKIVLQKKTVNPPLEVYSKLLWREFFFLVGSQVPGAHEMVNNSLSLQIPWEDSPEYLDKWKQVSLERKPRQTITCSRVLTPFLGLCYDMSRLYAHGLMQTSVICQYRVLFYSRDVTKLY